MTKSGIRTVTTKSRNFHSGVPPAHSETRGNAYSNTKAEYHLDTVKQEATFTKIPQ